MAHILMGVLAGVLALPLLFVGGLLSLSSGQGRVAWAYVATLLLSLTVSLWRAWKRTTGNPGRGAWLLRFRNAMVSLCLALCAGLVVALVGYGIASRPPTQGAVAVILQEHRADLDRLKDMVVADRLEAAIRFGSEFSRPEQPLIFRPPAEAGLTVERASRYSELMRAVGSERIDVWRDGTVLMSVAAWGAANRGWRMALAWSPVEPKPLLPTIDGFPGTKPAGAPSHAFSHLEGSWYVYVTW